MRNTLISRISLAAVIGFCFYHTAFANDSSNKNLMTWSIPEKSIPLEHPIYDKTRTELEETHCNSSVPARFLYLNQPNTGRKVAIIWFDQAGPAILNPPGFEYGPIPPLKEMTVADMRQLWGNELKDKATTSNEKVFLLKYNETEYQLEMQFENGQLKKYRVEGPGIRGGHWRSIT